MDDGPASADDPGWSMVLGGIPASLIPTLAMRRFKRQAKKGDVDGLVMLRSVFAAFAAAIANIAVVVVVLRVTSSLESVLPSVPVVLGVAVVGMATLAAVRFFTDRLDCSSDGALVGSYRTRFFLQLAFAESAALVGFLGFILTVQPLVYLVGAAFTAVGFTMLAPTAGNLAEDQYRLAAKGCPHNLTALLRSVRSMPQ